MFELSFGKMMIIALVALIVLGPEKLPRVARTIGHLLGRARSYANQVKQDIDREMQMDELRKLQKQAQDAAQQFQSAVNDASRQVESQVNQVRSAVEADPFTEPTAEPSAESAAASATETAADTATETPAPAPLPDPTDTDDSAFEAQHIEPPAPAAETQPARTPPSSP